MSPSNDLKLKRFKNIQIKALHLARGTMVNVMREAIFPYAKKKPNCIVGGYPRRSEQWKRFKNGARSTGPGHQDGVLLIVLDCKQRVGEERLGERSSGLVGHIASGVR
jgi:hypothetical protein